MTIDVKAILASACPYMSINTCIQPAVVSFYLSRSMSTTGRSWFQCQPQFAITLYSCEVDIDQTEL